MSAPSRPRLPPRLESLVAEVMDAADLDVVGGRAEVEADLRAHFEDGLAAGTSVDELVRRFGDPADAGRRIARAREASLGRGEPGGAGGWSVAREVAREAALAVRRLRRAPGFAAIVVLTLGLGVGANTAIFTVLDAVLLDDLPYAEPERLVRLYEGRVDDPAERGFLRVPLVREYRSWTEVFESVGALYTYREVGADLTDGDEPRRVAVVRAAAGYFETLGVAPVRGRTFDEDESFGPGESRGSTDLAAPVAMVSHRLWSGHFGGEEVVGRTIRLDGAPFEVVGVMPASFVDPLGAPGDVWIPQDVRTGGSNSFNNWYLSAVARLRDGITLETAREILVERSETLGEREPAAATAVARIEPLRDDVVGASRARMLWILAAAAGLVLLTACVNVANLVFARGLGRDRDLALRAALGSGRGRLAASVMAENALLAVLGGLAGLAVGWVALRGLLALAPAALPVVADVRVGARVFFFTLAVTAVALLSFGLGPALRLSRTAPADALRAAGRSATAGRLARRLRDGLVVAQVAAALVLVTSAVLLTRSFSAITSVDLAIEPRGVLTYEVNLPTARYPTGAERHAFHETWHDRVRSIAGVEAVGAVSWLPVSGRYHEWGFAWDAERGGSSPEADWNPTDVRIVAGDYFDAVGIDVLRGARPRDVDLEGEPVAWINRTVADEVFAGVDPVGRAVWLNGASRRIVGVVEDVPHGPRGSVSRKLYMPHAQYNDDRNWALTQVVRSSGDPRRLQSRLRAELAGLDGRLVLHRPRSLDDVLARVRAQDRFATLLMGGFATLALLLSLLGTYGVLSGNVAGRRREIGIRLALGADARGIRGMVLAYSASIVLPGIVLGLVAAYASGRWIEALLFDVPAHDPLAHAAAAGVLLAVGAAAAWLPARRATRVDAARTLTAE